MSRIDELEALSQMLAGELSPAEAARVASAPGLGSGIEALRLLDEATRALPVDLPAARVEKLVRATRPPRPRRMLALAAAVGCMAIAAAVWSGRPPASPAPVLVLSGAVMELAPGSQVLPGELPVLILGAALVKGRGEVLVGSTPVRVDGRAIVAREPPGFLDRVTSAGGDMTSWRKLAVPAAAAAALVAGVVVLDGTATVHPESPQQQELHAGQRLETDGGASSRSPRAAGDASPSSGSIGEDPLSELRRLRDEREQLLRERSRLRADLVAATKTAAGALASSPMNASHYRFSPAELEQMARMGMVLFRLPHLDAGALPYDDHVRTDLALTPEEEAQIRRIYAESFERIRSGLSGINVGLGGDPARVAGATPGSLWHDILEMRPAQERADATRAAARVRAGLSPATPAVSPSLQVALLLQGEDDRVITELDALLGPERAQQLLDNPGTQHSDFVSVHAPPPVGP